MGSQGAAVVVDTLGPSAWLSPNALAHVRRAKGPATRRGARAAALGRLTDSRASRTHEPSCTASWKGKPDLRTRSRLARLATGGSSGEGGCLVTPGLHARCTQAFPSVADAQVHDRHGWHDSCEIAEALQAGCGGDWQEAR